MGSRINNITDQNSYPLGNNNCIFTWCMIGWVGRWRSKGICWMSCMLRNQLRSLCQGLSIPALPRPHVVGRGSPGACAPTPAASRAPVWCTLHCAKDSTSWSETTSTSLKQRLGIKVEQWTCWLLKPGRGLLWVELGAGAPEMKEQGHWRRALWNGYQVKHIQLLKDMRCKMEITLNCSRFEEIV